MTTKPITWIVVLTLAIFALSVATALTPDFSECMNARAIIFTDDPRPTVYEQVSSFLQCEENTASAHGYIIFWASLGVIGILFAASIFSQPQVSSTQPNFDISPPELEQHHGMRRGTHAQGSLEMGIPATSNIAPHVTFRGTIRSEGNFHIEGSIEGDVWCTNLSIGPLGDVLGNVFAKRVIIKGKFKGALHATEIIMTAGSQVEGKILQRLLQIESGAKFSGECRHSNEPLENPVGSYSKGFPSSQKVKKEEAN